VTEDRLVGPLVPGTQSILVVDDTSVVRYTAFRLLSEAGFRVFEAESAVEALEVLQTARPGISLVLADVVMPSIGGVDMVRMIRDRWPRIQVVYMSAYGAEVLIREGLEDPRVFFLAKPFTRSELLDKVTAALQAAEKENEESKTRPPR
jgi:two-component system, cell cycle sensor histidine kinase and response regulator CckA